MSEKEKRFFQRLKKREPKNKKVAEQIQIGGIETTEASIQKVFRDTKTLERQSAILDRQKALTFAGNISKASAQRKNVKNKTEKLEASSLYKKAGRLVREVRLGIRPKRDLSLENVRKVDLRKKLPKPKKRK